MKFLCVQCDSKMNLSETSGPDTDGSLAVVFECEQCKQQVAMLTNAHETQMVSSLGVSIGGQEQKSKCPFTEKVRDAMEGTDSNQQGSHPNVQSAGIPWTEPALARLSNIPEFIRPMAKSGIEEFAKSKGYQEIDEMVLDQARGMFGA